MSLYLRKGLPFPKGIINIISDYSHTLFYMDELKEKIKGIYNTMKESQFFDLSYYYVGFLVFDNEFIITSYIYPFSNRHKLFDKENVRRVSFGMKERYNLWPKGYNKNYQAY